MKHLMNISLNVRSNLISENFRGEGRWECNTLNAFLSAGKQVHTTRHVWLSEEPRPSNLWDGTNEAWIPESVLFVHGAGRSLFIEREDVRAFILQFHELPFGQAHEDLLRYFREKRVVVTLASREPFSWLRATKAYGTENVYHLPGAMVPYVVEDADNFRKPNVTWSYRHFHSIITGAPEQLEALFSFLDPYLTQEPEIRIALIVGLWDSSRFGVTPEMQTIRDWALDFPVMKKFKHIHDRIDFYVNLHWFEVLKLLEKTRWIISPAASMGCPAYEAAMFGIPTIMNQACSPFITTEGGKLFPELLTAPEGVNQSFLRLLEKLQLDHTFYRNAGNAYRNYVKNHATFSAFSLQIDDIIQERGWNI